MTALASGTDRQSDSGSELLRYPVAATTQIWAGSAVVVNSAGDAKPAGPAASERFVGVSTEDVDNDPGTAGAEFVLVEAGKSFLFAGTGFAASDVGRPVYLTDDNTVSLTKGEVPAGVISRYVSSTSVYVYVPPGGMADVFLGDTSTAIHDDVAGEIAAITAKGTPVANDLLVIEDSAAVNAKKRATAVSLVTGAVGATSAAAVATSNIGVGDAGKLVKLDAAGKAAGRVLETDGTKLDGIEALADVTDLTNVTTALGVTAAAAVNTSAGAGDAGKLPKLGAAGLLHGTMLPGLSIQASPVAAGAPSQAEIVTAAASLFGDAGAAADHDGASFILDDSDTTASFLCYSDGTNWFYAGTIGA